VSDPAVVVEPMMHIETDMGEDTLGRYQNPLALGIDKSYWDRTEARKPRGKMKKKDFNPPKSQLV